MLLPERGNSLNPEAAGTSGAHVGQGWYRVVTGAVVQECISVMKIEGLPVIDVDESEKITVAVRADDLLEGDTANPEQHPIAIALRRQDNVDDARVTKNETLVRRGKKWFRYDAPNKRLFKQLQKSLTASLD